MLIIDSGLTFGPPCIHDVLQHRSLWQMQTGEGTNGSG